MNEKTQEILMSYMGKAEGALQNISDFASDQIPLVIQEYLSWQFYGSVINAIVFLTILSLALYLLNMLVNWTLKQTASDDIGPGVFGSFILLLFSLFMIAGFIYHSKEAVKVSVAPRVVIVDWLKDSVQK